MKKTLLNIAITLSLFGTALSTPAYANSSIDDNKQNNNTRVEDTTETYILPGIGIGAATGTAIAGPVGFVVGGLIGAFVGSNQSKEKNETQENEYISNSIYDKPEPNEVPAIAKTTDLPSVHVAQIGLSNITPDPTIETTQHNELLNILTTDLSLDIYFRSGSTNIESFYPARLTAISNLMENMNQLELHLDGYTDRRGNKDKNIALAKQRINNVRKQLIDSGVDENRIFSKAFGEIKMVSQAGDLDAYTFDRKVVIRFERRNVNSLHTMNEALSSVTPTINITESNDSSPIVANATTRF